MANVVLVLVVALVAWFLVRTIQRRRRGLVAERGLSIGADLGALADAPTVRVRSMADAGPGRVLVVLTPPARPSDDSGVTPAADLELVVNLREEQFGFNLLHQWMQAQTELAIVMPPDSRIVRLRAVDDLQPLTLSRVDKA